jgi:hypothetical protein
MAHNAHAAARLHNCGPTLCMALTTNQAVQVMMFLSMMFAAEQATDE